MNSIFEYALEEMAAKKLMTYGPISFKKYIEDYKLSSRQPAPNISIDSVSKLDVLLRQHAMMVFRLGSPKGEKYSYFALAKSIGGLSDYFIIDNEVFDPNTAEFFVPTATYRQLFPFALLPNFTETSVVNFCIASGLLSHALKIDRSELPSVPATGRGIYTFKVKPHCNINTEWDHIKGQVEIDAIITANRTGSPILFLIEAKAGTRLDSLGKHKLMYPFLSLFRKIPPYMQIIPVYLKAVMGQEEIHIYIAECETDQSKRQIPTIAGLTVRKATHYVMQSVIGASKI